MLNKKKMMAGVLATLVMTNTVPSNLNLSIGDLKFQGVLTANAYALSSSVTQNNVTYFYEDYNGDVTITYVNVLPGASEQVTIPSRIGSGVVTTIASRAFAHSSCANIKELILPNDLKTIGDKALQGCTNMTTVSVPQTIARVAGSTFGPYTKVEHLRLFTSSGAIVEISTGQQIKDLIKDVYVTAKIGNLDQFITCDKNGNLKRYGMFELLDSLTYSPFFEKIYKSYSYEIVKSIIPSAYTSDIQKMQIIYNYVLTNVRYSKIHSGTSEADLEMLNNTHQKAFGALFCNSGVCASEANTLYYLGKAAGLDIKTISPPGHRMNIFSPSGSNKYYYVDVTSNVFCKGYSAYDASNFLGKSTQTANEDGKVYNIAESFYGKTILVRIRDNNNYVGNISKFKVKLSDQDYLSRIFCNYNTSQSNDYNAVLLSNIQHNQDMKLYMYDNKYYQLNIKDGNKDVLTLNYALNHGDNYTTYFYDATNKRHTVNIRIIYDKNDTLTKCTVNNAYFDIVIN